MFACRVVRCSICRSSITSASWIDSLSKRAIVDRCSNRCSLLCPPVRKRTSRQGLQGWKSCAIEEQWLYSFVRVSACVCMHFVSPAAGTSNRSASNLECLFWGYHLPSIFTSLRHLSDCPASKHALSSRVKIYPPLSPPEQSLQKRRERITSFFIAALFAAAISPSPQSHCILSSLPLPLSAFSSLTVSVSFSSCDPYRQPRKNSSPCLLRGRETRLALKLGHSQLYMSRVEVRQEREEKKTRIAILGSPAEGGVGDE